MLYLTSMKLRHRVPCIDCPWKTDSLKGWLGGNDAYLYSDTVHNNTVEPCHNYDFRDSPDSGTSAPCVGALQCAANSATMMNDPELETARKAVGKNPSVFNFHWQFHEYHTGEKWVHPLIRK